MGITVGFGWALMWELVWGLVLKRTDLIGAQVGLGGWRGIGVGGVGIPLHKKSDPQNR